VIGRVCWFVGLFVCSLVRSLVVISRKVKVRLS